MKCCEYFKSYLIFPVILLIIISAIDCSSKIIINLEDVCEPFNECRKSLTCININSDEQQKIDELNGNYFKNHGLKSLFFSKGRFDVLPSINSDGLKSLTFFLIKINQIDLSSFKLTPNLEGLRFEYNELENLFENVFINLSHLQSLHIVHNRLTTLLKDNFNGLQTLRVLEISGNDMKQLPSDVFEHLISVTHLDLSNNSIEFLPSNVFEHLIFVTVIDLSYNSIEFLPSNLFDKNLKLVELDLSHNKLSKSEFIYPEYLKTLDLTWNNFEEIHLDRLPCILTTLKLGQTSLKRITKANTALKYKLRGISISTSRIDNFEFLENLCNLNDIDFSSAESLNTSAIFRAINTRESCTGEPNIKYLTLNNNKLKDINYELMANFKKLKILILRENYLTEIPYENLMIEHPQLEAISLYFNLFNCSFKAKMTKFFRFMGIRAFVGGCIDCNTDLNHEFYNKSCPESFLYNVSTPSIDIDYNVESTTKNDESKMEESSQSENPAFQHVEFSTEEVSNNSKVAKSYPPENDHNVNTETNSVKNDTHISVIKIIGIK